MKHTTLFTVMFAALSAVGCASYGTGGSAVSSSDAILTTSTGMTLYTFDKDGANTSNCYDGCAVKWPPYTASSGKSPIASATKSVRKDGSEQWTVSGSPLYTWVGDTKPGDTTGDGVRGVWHTATSAAPKQVNSSNY